MDRILMEKTFVKHVKCSICGNWIEIERAFHIKEQTLCNKCLFKMDIPINDVGSDTYELRDDSDDSCVEPETILEDMRERLAKAKTEEEKERAKKEIIDRFGFEI